MRTFKENLFEMKYEVSNDTKESQLGILLCMYLQQKNVVRVLHYEYQRATG